MELADIKNQKPKWVVCEIYIDTVGEAEEQQDGGFLQNIYATFAQGQADVIKYYYNAADFEIDGSEIGKQWYQIRWKGTYLQGNPTDPPENEPAPRGVDWDSIVLNKNRRDLLSAAIRYHGMLHINLERINQLANFCLTGEIEE